MEFKDRCRLYSGERRAVILLGSTVGSRKGEDLGVPLKLRTPSPLESLMCVSGSYSVCPCGYFKKTLVFSKHTFLARLYSWIFFIHLLKC